MPLCPTTRAGPAGRQRWAGRFGFLGGSDLAILKSAEHPEAAFEGVEYLTSVESQRRYGVTSEDLAELWQASAALSRDQVRAILAKATRDMDTALEDPAQTGIN